MAGLLIQNQLKAPVTVVDNRFIERYMADANGEFVKVYLCLLRFQGTDDLTVAGMADFLNHTEADVIRALRYWEKAGLLRIYQDGEGKPAGILLLNFEEEEREREAAATVQRKPEGRKIIPVKEKAEKKPGCSGTEETAGAGKQALGRTLPDLQKDEAFSQLLFLTEAYRKQPLSRKDMDIFVNLYGNLGMPAELLEYLVESCVEAGHVSAAYMEKVALNWHQAGIRTPEEAKAQSSLYKKEYFGALRALGISGRNPVKAELGY